MNEETLKPELEEIIDDEHNECVEKYLKLVNELQIDGYNVAAGVVEGIRADECRHERIYRSILRDVVAK